MALKENLVWPQQITPVQGDELKTKCGIAGTADMSVVEDPAAECELASLEALLRLKEDELLVLEEHTAAVRQELEQKLKLAQQGPQRDREQPRRRLQARCQPIIEEEGSECSSPVHDNASALSYPATGSKLPAWLDEELCRPRSEYSEMLRERSKELRDLREEVRQSLVDLGITDPSRQKSLLEYIEAEVTDLDGDDIRQATLSSVGSSCEAPSVRRGIDAHVRGCDHQSASSLSLSSSPVQRCRVLPDELSHTAPQVGSPRHRQVGDGSPRQRQSGDGSPRHSQSAEGRRRSPGAELPGSRGHFTGEMTKSASSSCKPTLPPGFGGPPRRGPGASNHWGYPVRGPPPAAPDPRGPSLDMSPCQYLPAQFQRSRLMEALAPRHKYAGVLRDTSWCGRESPRERTVGRPPPAHRLSRTREGTRGHATVSEDTQQAGLEEAPDQKQQPGRGESSLIKRSAMTTVAAQNRIAAARAKARAVTNPTGQA